MAGSNGDQFTYGTVPLAIKYSVNESIVWLSYRCDSVKVKLLIK